MQVCHLSYDCEHITAPMDSSTGEQQEGKVPSLYCSGVFNIIYSLFGIGTSASRDRRCPIIPFLFLCAAVLRSVSCYRMKKKTQ